MSFPELSVIPLSSNVDQSSVAKQYSRTKLLLGIASSLSSFVIVLVILASGVSREASDWASSVSANDNVALLLFLLAIVVIESIVTLPLGFYSGYVIEHKYNLSNQTPGKWGWEKLKGLLVGGPLVAILALVLWYCLKAYGNAWWLPVSIVLTFFSIVLARIAPTFIMPLFYTFTPLQEGSLKDRITALCSAAGVHIKGIFSFNMSKNTKKANAGFTGIGRSKRIILGDTLMNEFTEEEIETVFAHELGHYKYGHLVVGIVVGTVSTFVGLYVASQLYAQSLSWFGFVSITDMAALPLLGLWLSVFGLVTAPLGNVLSRKHEREADTYAVVTTKNTRAFVSALRKLAGTNLADTEPHPLVEFFFYSHPSIGRRIALIESLADQ